MKIFITIFVFLTTLYSECDNINIRAKNITTMEILKRVTKACNLSLFIKDTNVKNILQTRHELIIFDNFKLNKLLNTLLHDVFFDLDDSLLSLSSSQSKTFKIDYITSNRNGRSSISATVQKDDLLQDENSIVSIEVFDFWTSIKEELSKILNLENSTNSLIMDKNAGIVIINANKNKMQEATNYLELLKQRLSKQVLLSLSIISIELNKEHQSGVDWSRFSLSLDSSNQSELQGIGGNPTKLVWNNTTNLLSKVNFSMKGLVNFLESQGKTKVVSSPKILTMNNQQALITIGDNINYQIVKKTSRNQLFYEDKTLFIGILLNILAQISGDNEVIIRINPSISRFKYQEDDVKQVVARSLPPDTTQKKLSAVVKLKNNQTLILGGLMTKSFSNVKNGVPLLKSIPLLGKFFSSIKEYEHTNDLIFVINAKIIED